MLFQDFIDSFSANKCVQGSVTAQYIFENIIWRDDVRIKMAELSDVSISALSACAVEIQNLCNQPSSDLNLGDDTVKQSIGRMIASSLAPLGYTPQKRGRVNTSEETVFTSAKVYSYTGNATQKIVKTIVEL